MARVSFHQTMLQPLLDEISMGLCHRLLSIYPSIIGFLTSGKTVLKITNIVLRSQVLYSGCQRRFLQLIEDLREGASS